MNAIRHRSLSSSCSGFTLIEMLVCVGIISVVASIGIGSGIESYEDAIGRSNRSSVLWSVLRARAEAMNGICDGMSSCVTGIRQSATIDPLHVVVFDALSGLVGVPQNIVLGTSGATSTLSVNGEGQVSITP